MSNRELRNSFSVDFSYPVYFTRDLLEPENPLLAQILSSFGESGKIIEAVAVVDAGFAMANPGFCRRLEAYAALHPQSFRLQRSPKTLPGGEVAKEGFDVPLAVIVEARNLCRHSLVLAFGGGAFLDAAGLGAALFHRGISLVRFPTTVLAQNDSGVGVKNGINFDGTKNLLGTFAPPAAVVNDFSFLDSLERRDWLAGVAEAFKVAIIRDRDFLEWLIENVAAFPARDVGAMEALIRRCAALHVRHIATSGDPFESGSARPLDFGHWAAHKLESMTRYRLRHGEAVAIGIAFDLCYAAGAGMITLAEAKRVIRALAAAGLPIWDDALNELQDGRRVVLDGIREFREHLGGKLQVTFPNPFGQAIELDQLDPKQLEDAFLQLEAIVLKSI